MGLFNRKKSRREFEENAPEMKLTKTLKNCEELSRMWAWRSVAEEFKDSPTTESSLGDSSIGADVRKRGLKFYLLGRYFKRSRYGLEPCLTILDTLEKEFDLSSHEKMCIGMIRCDLCLQSPEDSTYESAWKPMDDAHDASKSLNREYGEMTYKMREAVYAILRQGRRGSLMEEVLSTREDILRGFLDLPDTWHVTGDRQLT